MIRVGQVFINANSGLGADFPYVLAAVNPKEMALIGLKTGNRWDEPVIVDRNDNVSDAEWSAITDGCPEDWVRVEVEIKVKG